MELIERLTADVATIKGALCILKSTVPIARNPTRVIDVTATFKQKKIDIVKEGFDPSRVRRPAPGCARLSFRSVFLRSS